MEIPNFPWEVQLRSLIRIRLERDPKFINKADIKCIPRSAHESRFRWFPEGQQLFLPSQDLKSSADGELETSR